MKKRVIGLAVILTAAGVALWTRADPDEPRPLEPPARAPAPPGVDEPAVAARTGLPEPDADDLELDNPPSVPEVPLSPRAAAERDALWQEVVVLLDCDANDTCPVDNSDPRASSVLLGHSIADALAAYTQLHIREDHFDAESLSAATALLDYPDGHVQEEALDLLALQPPDPGVGQALLDALGHSYDAEIVEQILAELLRYPELADPIDAQLESILTSGSLLAGEAVARGILPFLRPENIDRFEGVLAALPPVSARARALRSALEEHHLRTMGG